MLNYKQGMMVALGGMIGTTIRYSMLTLLSWTTVWITLFCNLTGAFLLAVLYRLIEHKINHPLFQLYRLFIGVGLLGGYTTFSTISLDSALLIKQEAYMVLILYIATTFIGGFIATICGYQLIAKCKKGGA